MIKTIILRNVLAGLAVLGVTSAAPAAVLVTETFSYPNGHLTSVSGGLWTQYSQDGDNPVQVFNERINLQHACNGGPCTIDPFQNEDLQRAFPASAAGQAIYAGFDVDVTVSGNFQSFFPSVYFAHFLAGTSHANRLWVTSFSGSDFTLGIGNSSASPAISWASGLTNNTTYRVVLSYDFDSGTSKLWINPANQTSASITFTDVASAPISAFGVRQDIRPLVSNTTQKLDNLVVGTRFRDVLAIPAPPLAGDYDGSGSVGPQDHAIWGANFGSNNFDADGNGNGIVDAADYVVWRNNVGVTLGSGSSATGLAAGVPEPSSMVLAAIGLAVIRLVNRHRTVGCSRRLRSHPHLTFRRKSADSNGAL